MKEAHLHPGGGVTGEPFVYSKSLWATRKIYCYINANFSYDYKQNI